MALLDDALLRPAEDHGHEKSEIAVGDEQSRSIQTRAETPGEDIDDAQLYIYNTISVKTERRAEDRL